MIFISKRTTIYYSQYIQKNKYLKKVSKHNIQQNNTHFKY